MKSLKLNQIASQKLAEKEMNNLLGGEPYPCAGMWSYKFDKNGKIIGIKCQCSCKYANNGGSSTWDNSEANDAHNLTSE